MNLYVRYFDHETLAHSIEECMSFLQSIKEIKVDNNTPQRLRTFLESDNTYPFRLKVSYSNYVLFLKTEAKDIAEFHVMEQMHKEQKAEGKFPTMAERKRSMMEALNEPRQGWYESSIMFKRVIVQPETQKCQYQDTRFRVRLKADSAMHCYNRIIEHLKSRKEVDPRSQYPSVKSPNFEYKFLGEEITEPQTGAQA